MSDTPTPAAQAPQAWTDDRIYRALYDISSRHPEDNAPILYGNEAESVCRQIRDDLSATIATQVAELAEKQQYILELEAELTKQTSKFETAWESANILGKMLEEARAVLHANGIYEDEGDDDAIR